MPVTRKSTTWMERQKGRHTSQHTRTLAVVVLSEREARVGATATTRADAVPLDADSLAGVAGSRTAAPLTGRRLSVLAVGVVRTGAAST